MPSRTLLRPVSRLLPAATALAVAACAGVAAQETPLPTPQELIERETVRPRIEALLGAVTSPPKPGEQPPTFHTVCDGLIAVGPPVVPFMAAELDLPTEHTFHIAAYVSGRVGGPAAIRALEKAVAAAEKEDGSFAEARKQWAVFGLALAGSTEAIDLALSGKHRVAWPEFYENMRLLEVLAGAIGPPAVPVLLRQLESLAADEQGRGDRIYVLRALSRVADRSAVPAVLPLLADASPRVRADAVAALGKIGDPAVADRVIGALDDKDSWVRGHAALAILDLKPAAKTKELLSRLETIQEADIRGRIYETLAELAGEGTLEAFRSHWNRPDFLDRTLLVQAVGRLGDRKGLPLLRLALVDPELNVVLHAIRSIAAIGGEGAVDTLVALVSDPRQTVSSTAVEMILDLRAKRGGPRIAGRLLAVLADTVTDYRMRDPVRLFGETLVALRYAEPLGDLRAAAARQTDPEIRAALDGVLHRLALVAANGDDVTKWAASLQDADPSTRRLACERIGEIGGKKAQATLLAAFEKASETADAVEILRAIGSTPSPESAAVVERVLSDAAWDAAERAPLRAMAAWDARRFGGAAMIDALRRSAERREGKDAATLLYLAQLAGKDALPTLRAFRHLRLRHFDWARGHEQDHVDWAIRELSAGRSVRKLDVSPERLHAH